MFQHVAMDTEVAGAVPENFPVEYQDKSGSLHNLALRGEGVLTLDPGQGVCVFSGKQRRMFGQPTSVTIPWAGIFNVVAVANRIVFDWRGSGPKAKTQPFVFFCRDEATAATLVQRLPSRKDEEFLAGRDFGQKLARLPTATTWWGSPTNLIVAVNALAFVAMGLLGAGWFETADMMVYVRYGANNGAVTTDGEWWRLLTSMFMHLVCVRVRIPPPRQNRYSFAAPHRTPPFPCSLPLSSFCFWLRSSRRIRIRRRTAESGLDFLERA